MEGRCQGCHTEKSLFPYLYISHIWTGYGDLREWANTGKQEILLKVSQPAITCSKLTAETPEQGMKYVQR